MASIGAPALLMPLSTWMKAGAAIVADAADMHVELEIGLRRAIGAHHLQRLPQLQGALELGQSLIHLSDCPE